MAENNAPAGRPARVLMTGSRDWSDGVAAHDALSAGLALLGASPRASVLVRGGAAGADSCLAGAATTLGMQQEPHIPDWRAHGPECPEWDRRNTTCKLAGHRRNAIMVAAGADLCLAFPTHGYHLAPGEDRARTSRGTWNCAESAKVAGIPTVVVWGRALYPFGWEAAQLLAATAAAKSLQLGGEGQLPILDAWLPF